MRVLLCALFALIACGNGDAWSGGGEVTPTPTERSAHINDGNFSKWDHLKQQSFQHQQQLLEPPSDSGFNLKVQVNNVLSGQSLSQAVVDVYMNYSRTNTALTGDDGGVLLHVPYQAGVPITIVASKEGYMCKLMPCRANRMPIFSSVTVSLLAVNQGNIWLFDDSVLITGKASDASSQPTVQFPKRLLNLTDSSNVTSIEAYLTIPKLPSEEDSFLNTLGITSSKSGYVGVELSPVAAVSVQLFSGGEEIHVSGAIGISLSITPSFGLQPSDVVPAWFFNRTTGGWMRKGLGNVESVEGKLMWTFTAPHLGYWIAAPVSPTSGFFGLAVPMDFILSHSSLLMLVLGGALVIVLGLLVWLLFCHRHPLKDSNRKKGRPVMTKDQTTSTCDQDVLQASSGESFTGIGNGRHNALVTSMHNGGDVIANPIAVTITVERDELELNTDLNDLKCLYKKNTEQIRAPASLTDNLFFYNQPVAILHAPAFFHMEEQSEDSLSHTLTKGPSASHNQAAETEDHLGVPAAATSTADTSMGHYSLGESASVPGTLSKMGDSRHSVPALADLSKLPSLHPPRAWFVSLEGKPAAEIHYSVSEQQRRRRPGESRDTSLDSGVDMSELNQASGRRAVTLERNATFVKSKSSGQHHAPPQ